MGLFEKKYAFSHGRMTRGEFQEEVERIASRNGHVGHLGIQAVKDYADFAAKPQDMQLLRDNYELLGKPVIEMVHYALDSNPETPQNAQLHRLGEQLIEDIGAVSLDLRTEDGRLAISVNGQKPVELLPPKSIGNRPLSVRINGRRVEFTEHEQEQSLAATGTDGETDHGGRTWAPDQGEGDVPPILKFARRDKGSSSEPAR